MRRPTDNLILDALIVMVLILTVVACLLSSAHAINLTSRPSMGQITNVDTTTVITGDFLVWNGTWWVGGPYDTTFVFDILTFTENISNTVLIGNTAKAWLAIGGITFSATYMNGPPSVATVNLYSLPAGMSAWGSALDMGSPNFTGPTISVDSVDYPDNKDVSVYFRLTTTPSDTKNTGAFTFRNYIYAGTDTKNTGWSSADIAGLTDKDLTNDHTRSMSPGTAGVNDYIIFAYPANYTLLDGGDDYETDGLSDFRFNGFTIAMNDAVEIVSVTNSAGEVENYDVWASVDKNLGNHTLNTSTSSAQTINWIHFGMTTETDSSAWDAADIHAAADSSITNQEEGDWTVTAGAGEYVMFAWPKRTDADPSTLEFKVGSLPGGFRTTQTISVTNSNGWTEDYYMTTSQNANLTSGVPGTLITGRGL